MAQLGDTVRFFPGDGRVEVEAEVTAIAEDGTISILYLHPNPAAAADGVRASAEGVKHGAGGFQYLEVGEEGSAASASIPSSELEALQVRVDAAEKLLADEQAAHEATKAELATLTGGAQVNLQGMTRAELDAHAETLGLDTTGEPNKDAAIAAIEAKQKG